MDLFSFIAGGFSFGSFLFVLDRIDAWKKQKEHKAESPKTVIDKKAKYPFNRKSPDQTGFVDGSINQLMTQKISAFVYASEPLISGWVYYDKDQYLEASSHEMFAIMYEHCIFFGRFKHEDYCDFEYLTILGRGSNGSKWEGSSAKNSLLDTSLVNKLWRDFLKTESSPVLLRDTILQKDEIMVGETPISYALIGESPKWMKLAIKKDDATIKIIEVENLWAEFTPVQIAAIKQKEKKDDEETKSLDNE